MLAPIDKYIDEPPRILTSYILYTSYTVLHHVDDADKQQLDAVDYNLNQMQHVLSTYTAQDTFLHSQSGKNQIQCLKNKGNLKNTQFILLYTQLIIHLFLIVRSDICSEGKINIIIPLK